MVVDTPVGSGGGFCQENQKVPWPAGDPSIWSTAAAQTVLWWTLRFVCGACRKRHMENHPQSQGDLNRRLARWLVQDATSVRCPDIMGWGGIWSIGLSVTKEHRRKHLSGFADRRDLVKTMVIRDPQRHRGAVSSKAALTWISGVTVGLLYRYLPVARHVLDRFHAVFDGSPKGSLCMQRRQPPGVKPAFQDLFRARFALLKRHLLEPNRDASNGYSPLIRVFGWPGTLYKSCTASIRPTTSKAPWTASPSTKPARFPSTTTP